ncbi:MAG: dihydropteroate synthase [bacterium]
MLALQKEKSVFSIRQVRTNGVFRVEWNQTLLSFSAFARKLKRMKAFDPRLSESLQKSLAGYLPNRGWRLPGPNHPSFRWKKRTQVMGVLNVTPDSFSDGGAFIDPDLAVEQALQMQEEGADWIDVGGESTRPGARSVSSREEKKRVIPVIRACARALRIPISIDTYKAEVARAAVGEGARMVNDIGALGLDRGMARTLAQLKVPVILMHMKGRPRTMQVKPVYAEVVEDVLLFLRDRMRLAREAGIQEERILLDPGFGFGKSHWHNLELTRRLFELKTLGRPLVFGPSRKSTLGVLLGGLGSAERLDATLAAVTAGVLHGADFVRVHDVQNTVRAVKIADALRYDRGLKRP